ncbi:type II secretion system F family protein [Dactylosporangium salmoneum]|uniref:Type II secretion system protein GspF domain-containing protein n=1 Tax=Dactylosporangium salmoneum TaxID=53361 RepID=A0ABP5UR10_9ACTN
MIARSGEVGVPSRGNDLAPGPGGGAGGAGGAAIGAWVRWPVAVLAGLVIALAIGGVAGVVVGLVVAGGCGALLGRVEPARVRRERAAARADLQIAAGLLAAALRAGAPPDRAAVAVGEALGGPVGARLARVGRALRLGAEPGAAWGHLADLPGGARFARAAARSAEHGLALTRTLDRQATDLRVAKAAAADAAVRRVGVLAVLPVGLCFLPAFVLTGVIPVVIAVVHDVLAAL